MRFVDVYWDGYSSRVPTNLDPYWDTHYKNFEQLEQVNLPYLDQTFDALMEDLEQRGLLDETLVVMMSDFGRTPRVNSAAGRNHWTFCYSVLLAGTGIRAVRSAVPATVTPPTSRIAQCGQLTSAPRSITASALIRRHRSNRSGHPVPMAHGGEPVGEILA